MQNPRIACEFEDFVAQNMGRAAMTAIDHPRPAKACAQICTTFQTIPADHEAENAGKAAKGQGKKGGTPIGSRRCSSI
jgi:hypothetical protein